jgi:acetyl esterase
MALDPQVKTFLDLAATLNVPGFHEMPVDLARRAFRRRIPLAGPPEPVARVEDRTPPGLARLRIYTPGSPDPLPALVYFHGGGWVLGDLDTVDAPCRRLANAVPCVVVSVAYPLAPEHTYPIAIEDAYFATRYVVEHAGELGIDPARIAVGGDSAGGNLAAVVALMARDRGGPPLAFQLLVYPIIDCDTETWSYRQFAEGFGLTRAAMRYYWSQYLSALEGRLDPLASPLRAPDLRGLPPAFVMTAEYDVLRDEGEAYADRLRAAGVRVEGRRYEGLIHGFFTMAGQLDRGRMALDDAAAALRGGLEGRSGRRTRP